MIMSPSRERMDGKMAASFSIAKISSGIVNIMGPGYN